VNTVWQIIQERGGLCPGISIALENEPWMRLVIEVLLEPGPAGHVVVSVGHYGEQNSDLMRDPEMLFEVVETHGSVSFQPFYFRNDYIGVEQWSRYRDEFGTVMCDSALTRELETFAAMWDRNLKEQGFLRTCK
jgi:hypothetical protein